MTAIGYHCVSVVHGGYAAFWATPGWFVNYGGLPMFFALSGFLLCGSAQRLNLRDFMLNRGFRIMPALAVEIGLSALILGPLYTDLPLSRYFTSVGFFHYFTNIFGWVNFYLPGVFCDMPDKVVNSSLWTIPWEIGIYLIMAALMVTGVIRRSARYAIGAALFLMIGSFIFDTFVFGHPKPQGLVNQALWGLFVHRGNLCLIAFFAGIAAYQLRYRIPFSGALCAVAVAACVATAVWMPKAGQECALIAIFTIPALVYAMLYVGLTAIPKIPVYSTGDYSYGMYLYGYPIQQVLMHRFHFTNVYELFACAIPTITLVAALSWHGIEKPALRMRKRFSLVAQQGQAQRDRHVPRVSRFLPRTGDRAPV